MELNRFRLLVVEYLDMKELYKQDELIKTAIECAWIGGRFKSFMDHNNASSAAIEPNGLTSTSGQIPPPSAPCIRC